MLSETVRSGGATVTNALRKPGLVEYRADVAGKDVVETLPRGSIFPAQVARRVDDEQ